MINVEIMDKCGNYGWMRKCTSKCTFLYNFSAPPQKCVMGYIQVLRGFSCRDISLRPLQPKFLKFRWARYCLTPKMHVSCLCRSDSLRLSPADRLPFFLRNLGQRLKNQIADESSGKITIPHS